MSQLKGRLKDKQCSNVDCLSSQTKLLLIFELIFELFVGIKFDSCKNFQ
jgi:hypothetical protein